MPSSTASAIGLSSIGLSTYSFFWQWHETAPRPLSLTEIVAKTASWDVDLLQLCDYPALDRYDAAQTADLAAAGRELGVAYELGTRGLDTAHLLHYLELAGRLDVTLVRSMVKRDEIADAPELLAKVVPAYADAGVTLALETYEQIPTQTLVDLVAAEGSAYLGIVLDPGNSRRRPRDPALHDRPHRAARPQPARQGLRLQPAGRLGRVHVCGRAPR